MRSVPDPIHILLDTLKEKEIRWIPYHLQFVVDMMYHSAFPQSPEYRQLAFSVQSLCNAFYTSKEHSGDGWESLFVLFLLARCIAPEPHNPVAGEPLVPQRWFAGEEFPHVSYNSYAKPGRLFSECKNWKDLEKGLILKDAPQLSIFYPSHTSFEVYDVIVVFSKDEKVVETYGYQCKQGKVNPDRSPDPSITCSFVLKGDSPQNSMVRRGWQTPSTADLEDFSGVFGRNWTPQAWRRLTNTIDRKAKAAP